KYHLNPDVAEYDAYRTEKLTELGFNVIRFENKMVFDSLSSVLKDIEDNFKN
ncbi:MAG: DUF559 domain-containing protein, partial [Flavobacteriales bacterium]